MKKRVEKPMEKTKGKLGRKLICICALALLLAGVSAQDIRSLASETAQAGPNPLSASAGTVPDLSQKGSVSVTLRDPQTKEIIYGGSLTLYRVADIKEEDGNYSFVYTKKFSGCGGSLDAIQSDALPRTLEAFVKREGLEPDARTGQGEAGVFRFSDLETGLYLLSQDTAAEGRGLINPFLVTVPYYSGDRWIYDVDASPKVSGTEPGTEPTTEPATEPGTEPATEPATEPGTEPTTEPATEPATEPETEPSPKPGTEPDTEPDTQPSPKPPGSSNPSNPPFSTGTGTSSGTLPQTGQLWWPIPLLAFAGVILFMIGWFRGKTDADRKSGHEQG